MNPFELLYSALWELALSNSKLAAEIKVGNRVRFDSATNRDPEKAQVQVADLPELLIAPDGTQISNLHATSCSASISRRFLFRVSTGDLRAVDEGRLLRIEWLLMCALVNWKSTLTALEWNGERFVKNCRALELRNSIVDIDANRNARGWAAVWGCEVDCAFSITSLLGDL